MKTVKKKSKAILLSLIIGAVIGITAGFYGEALHTAEHIRESVYLYTVPFMGVIGVFILFLYKRTSPESEQGLNLAIAYTEGHVDTSGHIMNKSHAYKLGKYPKAYAILKLFTNIVMLFFGASTGKEGSFAAFGASIGDYVARIFKSRRLSRTLLLCGVGAAVSGLFQTPLGGVFFALEFAASGSMPYSVLLPVTVASYSAVFFSKLCGFTAFSCAVDAGIATTPKTIVLIALCAVIYGLFGRLFADTINKAHHIYHEKVKNRYLCMLIVGSVLAILLIALNGGRYCGTGAAMVSELFSGGEFMMYDFALKFVFTILCITIGFSGGEMMPLLAIGASLGATLGTLFGLPIPLCGAIGAVSVYSSATNTLLAAMFIGIEMFGTDSALYIALSCVIAYAVNGNKSVYTLQKHSRL